MQKITDTEQGPVQLMKIANKSSSPRTFKDSA